MDNLKPCPNCGTEGRYTIWNSGRGPVQCSVCCEQRTLEEWQTDSARERILQSELTRKDSIISAQAGAIEAEKALATFYAGTIVAFGNALDCAEMSFQLPGEAYNKQAELHKKAESARAKLKEIQE